MCTSSRVFFKCSQCLSPLCTAPPQSPGRLCMAILQNLVSLFRFSRPNTGLHNRIVCLLTTNYLSLSKPITITNLNFLINVNSPLNKVIYDLRKQRILIGPIPTGPTYAFLAGRRKMRKSFEDAQISYPNGIQKVINRKIIKK